MKRVSKQDIYDYISDVADIETEHRKGSTFYANASHTFGEEDIESMKDYGVDGSELIGLTVHLSGYWSEYDGCEWDMMDIRKYEDYEEFVPEVVIPAHYVPKQREVESFVAPVFE